MCVVFGYCVAATTDEKSTTEGNNWSTSYYNLGN